MSPYAKFRATICNNKPAMGDKLNSRWRPPPFWIYYCCQFWSYHFLADYTPAKFH